MDKLNHPLARGASYLLIYLTALQPLHPAFAAGINAANGNTQVQQGNVPVVNIATPNGAGISHNSYQDFNVAAPGAVLNNATAAGQSQLAGQLNANGNLKGKAAELIINEVTGGSRSELQGKLEVFGKKANVMIANPNGISCDGCGFINAPGVTLTTGKPQFDKQGALEALEVKKGGVTIGGKGLDGYSADYVDIISRATELNGQIKAKNLSLTQGANRISFKDGTVTPIAGEGAKPVLAVDTKALGGMYANKIRLVANEDGVGVNLKDLITNQRDITLNVNGKITLAGATRSRTDLNVSARDMLVAPGATVQADQDATLASQMLTNAGQITASHDIRVFSDTVRNVGADTKIHANRNLWLQKDAQGNKANLVENRSAKIMTNSGDLVIRTEQLNNVRDVVSAGWKNIPGNSKAFNKSFVGSYYGTRQGVDAVVTLEPELKDFGIGSWFGEINLSKSDTVNVGRDEYLLVQSRVPGVISSGGNAYINAASLLNDQSNIKAEKDLILTGKDFTVKSLQFGQKDLYWRLGTSTFGVGEFARDEDAPPGDWDLLYVTEKAPYTKQQELQSWQTKGYQQSLITAGNNLIVDVKNIINIDTPLPYDPTQVAEVTVIPRGETLSAKNVLLKAGTIKLSDVVVAKENVTLLADNNIALQQGVIQAGNSVAMTAINNIDLWQSNVNAQDITLLSRNGPVYSVTSAGPHFFNPDGSRWFSSLYARGDLTIQAGQDVLLLDSVLADGKNITINAGSGLKVWRSNGLLNYTKIEPGSQAAVQQRYNDALNAPGNLGASGSITLSSNGHLDMRGTRVTAGQYVSIVSGNSLDLNPRDTPPYASLFPESQTPVRGSRITAGRNILLHAARDIGLQGATVYAGKNLDIMTGNLWLAAVEYTHSASGENDLDIRHLTTLLRAEGAMSLVANRNIAAYGTDFSSGGNMYIAANGPLTFEAVKNRTQHSGDGNYSESVTQQSSVLNSGGLLTLLSNGSILFQGTRLLAKGTLDVAAKGGYLYAQAVEEFNHYEDKKKTCSKWSFCITKKEVTQTRHDVTNKVTEFSAGGDINLLSRDDSTYEASKIEAGKNARLTSTNGKINFRAVKNTSFEQTVSISKGFFIKQADKGYTDTTWLLPNIYTGGKLTIDAAQGVTADVKAQNGQALQSAINAMGNSPGTEWLKGLNQRGDVQWSVVKDAYDSWDYKSQSLNPAVAAVIAIAAAAVTAGAGLAAAAGNSAVTATGAAGASASAVYGSAYAGMTSLMSQAAVALVENQGNLSKTLKALGSSGSVKSVVTAMAIGGALAGFDERVLKLDVPADKARLPVLNNEDWGKVAQRVAGQSIISSSLNTTINGGSFKDNLTNALLANIGSQVQAEGAHLIGDNGDVLGVAGKSVSHAVLAGISAEIGKGDGKGAAAGALAAELAGVIINDNLVRSEGWQERQAQISRVAGAFAGAIVTAKAAGATSGANAGEFVERFNRQLHQEELNAIKELAKGDKEKEARLMAASCRKVACTTQEALNSDERKQFEALMNKYPSTRDEDGLIANYWVQKERQRFGNYPAFAGYDSEKLFTYDLGDQITDGQLFARNQQIEQISKLTGWSPDWVNASVMAVSIASTFAGMGKANVGNQYLSSKLVGPTSAWKGYLVNEKTVQQAAAFRQQVLDARAPFAEKIRKKGNAAVAQIDVPGMPKTLAAHSRIAKAEKSFIGDGNQNFKYETIKNSDGILISRNTDSEYKILDNLADKLGNNVSAEGSVTIFTERAACDSCLGVVEQFQKKYPRIKVEVLDNNDVMLIPGRLK
ncbi:DUF637 domain-containing protein [Serratia entomophila]|uniref:DUF637 domain-containing protein n=1 Tax=Serratia entomophila TaxID=42906 RepID=UPI002178EF58|nr:DUF637 domain-containing protein [Serratia entomophila]CAI1015233.1 Hemolysin precursor [Serratia entomophila]CAI1682881.1 Hemolysin precursor [Serratia entomophila]CAI1741958.1 Hemolysin precursor [Serratia entomophila]CAI1759968.1 Hemolysin precursor [Serratia entomophila]CAI1827867.1 Hemolysin precursor [Serratia entomophila]